MLHRLLTLSFCRVIYMSHNKIHIGTLIRQECKKQQRGATWLANQLFCNRVNIYKIYSKASIDTELLRRISEILKHDFFADLSRSVSSECNQ